MSGLVGDSDGKIGKEKGKNKSDVTCKISCTSKSELICIVYFCVFAEHASLDKKQLRIDERISDNRRIVKEKV